MKARDLERLLVGEGATASKLSTIMGHLRETNRLPRAGRGPYAPMINATHAATMLAAVAGTARANVAGRRIEALERLTLYGAQSGDGFIERLAQILDDANLCSLVQEVRVARTIGRAVIVYRTGRIEEFLSTKRHDLNRRFRTVGELPGGLLEMTAQLLKAEVKKRKPKPRADLDD